MNGEDFHALWAGEAARYGVCAEIHPDDLLWTFVLGHPAFPTPADAARYYFEDGARSAENLAQLVAQHVRPGGARPRLLEFASGYGMVTRHLANALPAVDVLSCDIHPAAVDFIADRIGGNAILSEHQPEDLQFEDEFDVVFALSFFSHMPKSSFGRWLGTLFRATKPGGFLIFTTHGRSSAAALGNPEIDDEGFWFMSNSEQDDLDGAEYGSTLSAPEYVIRQLYDYTQAPIAEFRGGFWWQHQDLYVVAKPER